MTSLANIRTIATVTLLAGLALLPLYCHLTGNFFLMSLFTRIIILAMAAVSLNLIMGFGGMVSFGHATYIGIGGYTVGILAHEGVTSGCCSGRWRSSCPHCSRPSSERCRCVRGASTSS